MNWSYKELRHVDGRSRVSNRQPRGQWMTPFTSWATAPSSTTSWKQDEQDKDGMCKEKKAVMVDKSNAFRLILSFILWSKGEVSQKKPKTAFCWKMLKNVCIVRVSGRHIDVITALMTACFCWRMLHFLFFRIHLQSCGLHAAVICFL